MGVLLEFLGVFFQLVEQFRAQISQCRDEDFDGSDVGVVNLADDQVLLFVFCFAQNSSLGSY